jgi:benzil reductase ((S)-benzoin forming)
MAERLCVVTGTSSGLGLALAGVLLDRGWSVLGVARRAAPLDHPAYRHTALDLGDAATLEAFCVGPLDAAARDGRWARLGLVNCAAALGPIGPVSRLPAAALARAFAVNAVAPLRLTGALLAAAGRRPLRIVDVSSGAASRPYAGWAAYCASKAALRMAGQVVAEEAVRYPPGPAGPPDLAVVSYEPGVVDTPMQAEVRASPLDAFPELERFKELHARGRLVPPGRPAAEVADLLERDGLPRHQVLRLNG